MLRNVRTQEPRNPGTQEPKNPAKVALMLLLFVGHRRLYPNYGKKLQRQIQNHSEKVEL